MKNAGYLLLAGSMAFLFDWIVKEFAALFMEQESETSVSKCRSGICGILQMTLFGVYERIHISAWILLQMIILWIQWKEYRASAKNKFYYIMLFFSVEMFIFITIGTLNEWLQFGRHLTGIWEMMICIFLMFLFIRVLQIYFYRRNILLKISRMQYMVMVLIFMSSICLLGWLGYGYWIKATGSNTMVLSAMFFNMLLIYFWMFHEIKHVSDRLWMQQRNFAYQQEVKYYHQYLRDRKVEEQKVKEVRHDIKHKIYYMKDLLEKGRYKELKAYLQQMAGELEGIKKEIADSGNTAIDGMLNSK